MKILLVHNHYAQRGGEDRVFAQEADLLRTHGHEVLEYTKDNQDTDIGPHAVVGLNAVWARDVHADLVRLMQRVRPDIVHIHNTWPRISPAAYHAAARCGVPVVQTLHNYRLICANGLLLRNGTVCEDCVGKTLAWPAIRHKCYRGSVGASASVAVTVAVHRMLGTWANKVSRYIALCHFSRDKLLAAGLPPHKVVVKPNFAPDRHASAAVRGEPRQGALYLGRLSSEKGVQTLVDAWRASKVTLDVIGTGPLQAVIRSLASPSVHVHGFISDDDVTLAMRRASFLVLPSLVYEGFPMVVAETYSAGTPIIASQLGALAELVEDGVTGLHFNPGDAADLAAKVRWANEHPEQMAQMGRHARRLYEERYTPEVNHSRLMQIYDEACSGATSSKETQAGEFSTREE